MTTTDKQHEPVTLTRKGESILFPDLPYDMHARSERAVTSAALIESVETATFAKHEHRKKAFAEVFGDRYDNLRDLGGRIKQHTLAHLDHYLERFIDNAEAAGAQVHYANDAEQANAICVDIARREKLTACVKSKSMLTEETHLLPTLEAVGIETLETDLGEFILQIDHDAPSHIVTPMIHKNRQAVARAFVRELDVAYTEDPEQLTMIARRYLRSKYRDADLGITGANFLVADTGSLVICANEGNATFCTTAPRVHVAFVGIEKLVPSFEHAAVLLKLLARSSTGQPLTIYTDIVTGPKRAADTDGPEQVHIILVDNGRSDILADAEMRPTLQCIRCGACLNACPVYRKVSGHSYGAVYSGPIGALVTPLFKGLGNYKHLPYASSLCGACYEACPVKIDIPRLLVALRRKVTECGHVGRLEKMVFAAYAASLKRRWSYELGGWL
ncbi:MAG: iron-sulfur cluster-binding protein, partial [Planctomycetes bacterium]|nr:iron-sulfur cluster-binding protein [Planctomycetota bacterium]